MVEIVGDLGEGVGAWGADDVGVGHVDVVDCPGSGESKNAFKTYTQSSSVTRMRNFQVTNTGFQVHQCSTRDLYRKVRTLVIRCHCQSCQAVPRSCWYNKKTEDGRPLGLIDACINFL
jgi:hypothetical protein